MAACDDDGVRVVIVGAGIAGLSAASRLCEKGVKDVIVVEAQDRFGGRINTVNFGESVIELGAQWIHGRKGNCVHKLAKKHDLISDSPQRPDADGKDRSLEFSNSTFLTSKGEQVDMATVSQMTNVFMDIYDEADEFFSRDSETESDSSDSEEEGKSPFKAREMFPSGQTPKSYGEFFDECSQRFLIQCEKEDPDSIMLKRAFCEWEKQWQYADNACSSLHSVGLKGWGKYIDCKGDEHIEFKNGFKSLLDVLTKNIPSESILLSKPVRTIHWQTPTREENGQESMTCQPPKADDSERKTKPKEQTTIQKEENGSKRQKTRSVVECEDGSRFEADYIIMTPSLGILKEREATLFEPMLPESKRNAVRSIEFGTVNKIFLEWETRFWDEGCSGFEFLWLEDAPVVINSDKCDTKTKSGKPWYHNFRGFETIINQPNVLQAFICGEDAIILEGLDDEEVMDVCVEILAFFSKMHVPRPKRIIRSAWYSNPYVRGSYSLLTPDTPLQDHDMLREPLPSRQHPVLLFAGEACSKHHFTASHGAMETGLSAADDILKDLKK